MERKLNMTTKTRLPVENIGIADGESFPEGKGHFKNFILFPTTIVEPGKSATIFAFGYVPYKPRRLVVAPNCAPFFDINDVSAGIRSIIFNAGAISATCFPPLPLNIESKKLCEEMEAFTLIQMPTMSVNHRLGINVTNTSDKPHNFQAMFWVEPVEAEEELGPVAGVRSRSL